MSKMGCCCGGNKNKNAKVIKVELCSHCLHNSSEKDSVLEFLKKTDRELIIEETGCLGSCKGIVARINGEVYTDLNPEKLKEILNEL